MPIKIEMKAEMSKKLQKFLASLGDAGRAHMWSGAAAQLDADFRAHIRQYSKSHHKTADKLGAMRTGHLEHAAESVEVTHTADAATVAVRSPGITRAFRSLVIRPVSASALTIPIHALAYGKRVRELARNTPIFRPKKKNYLATIQDGKITVLYLLRRAANIKQDRSILPSNAAILASVKKGMKAAFENAMGGVNA